MASRMPVTAEQIQEFVLANAMSKDDARRLAGQALEAGLLDVSCPRVCPLNTHRPRAISANDSLPDVTETLDEYRRCGYGLCDEAFEIDDLTKLARAVFAVQNAGWPVVFSFIYDQFWTILDAPKLRAFLTSVVGRNYQTTPRFLVNYVPATPWWLGLSTSHRWWVWTTPSRAGYRFSVGLSGQWLVCMWLSVHRNSESVVG